MNTNKKGSAEDQEIDLSDISRRVGNAFQNLNVGIFKAIQFVIRNAIIIGVLFILGVVLGFYLDKTQKRYEHQIIVSPNFGSVDYLYSKINLINAKIKEGDTVFLKSIGLKNPKKLSRIKIEPIVDIYRFVNNSTNEQNFQLFKLMAEDGDIKKVVEESTTAKNYTYHAISLSTRSLIGRKNTIDPLLNYLNDNEFFNKVQVEYIRNTAYKMRANQQIIDQIDNILGNIGQSGGGGSQIYINENTQLNDVIQTKDKLLQEQGNYRIEMISTDKVIKDNSVITNIENDEAVNGKLETDFAFIIYRDFRGDSDFQIVLQKAKPENGTTLIIAMNFYPLELKGCFVVEPKVLTDDRGYFMESFNERAFSDGIGDKVRFVQDNQSYSTKGVLRGMHYQTGEHAQAKLVRVIHGEVQDVVVDIRRESPTFGKHISIVLSAENKKQLFIPRGFAHGFLVLSENATFFYKCDNFYNRESEGGIFYADPQLEVDWQLSTDQLIISEKDQHLPTLENSLKL